jgi:hypothetical protein
MSGSDTRRGFAARPGGADRWVKAPDVAPPSVADQFTARLTIDVTPELRRRLKLAALQRGATVADMLRALFEREFPRSEGGES